MTSVLHLTSTFPRDERRVGGGFVADLASAERVAGLDVVIVAPHDAGLPAHETMDEVRVHRFRYGPERLEVLAYRGGLAATARRPIGLLMVPAFLFGTIVAGIRVGRRSQASVVHAHWWFPSGVAGLVVARMLGVPLVVSLHGSDVSLARRAPMRWLARAVLKRAAVVAAVSPALAAEASAVLGWPPDRIIVAPMPVPAVGHAPAPPIPAPPPLRLIAAGRLMPEKGVDVLLEAMRLLQARDVDVELEVVGSGPERPRLAALAAPLGHRVTFHESVSQSELHDAIRQAHVLVVPSRREGLGLVAVEALALGRPVVASAVGGLIDTIEDGVDGTLVPPGDAAALADALVDGVWSRRPAARRILRHDRDTVARSHGDIYREAERIPAPRWRPWRWLGAATAAAVLVALVRVTVRDWPAIRQAWRHPDGTAVIVAVVAALVADAGFGLASAGALRASCGEAARPSVWTVARAFWVAQTAKNIPGAVWTAIARAGVAAGWGIGARATLRWLATEAAASCAAGAVVGGAAMAVAGAGGHIVGPVPAWAALAVAGAAAPMLLAVPMLSRWIVRITEAAPRPRDVARAAVGYVGVWVAAGAGVAALARAIHPLGGRALVIAAAAGVVASVAGFVAVPVPAGLGVREAVLIALLHPVLSTPLATSVALGSRVLAVAVQSGLAVVGLPAVRGRRHAY